MLSIGNRLPDGFYMPDLASADNSIGDRSYAEIPAEANTVFNSSNNVIEFVITNSSAFWDSMNSYIRFKLTADIKHKSPASGAATIACKSAYLNEGGGHALIKDIEILSASNTSLERIREYPKWYSIASSVVHSRDYIDRDGMREGDSADYMKNLLELPPIQDSTATTVVFSADMGINGIVRPLDTILVGGRLLSVASVSDTTITFTAVDAPNAVVNDEFNTETAYLVTGDLSARVLAATETDYDICLQPLSGFLESDVVKCLPYFAGSGIRVRITLAPAWQAFSVFGITAPNITASYTINNPVYVCNMVRPREAVMNEWYAKYKAGEITYSFLSPTQASTTIATTTGQQVINVPVGVRSAKAFLMRIQDDRAQSEASGAVNCGLSSWAVDKSAQGLRAGLKSFQVSAGGQYYFPTSQPLNTEKKNLSEVLTHVQACFYSLGSSLLPVRFLPSEWHAFQSRARFHIHERGGLDSVRESEPQRLILGCLMSKDPSPMSGIDLSANSLIVNLDFGSPHYKADNFSPTAATAVGTATPSSRHFQMFVVHDRFISVSADRGTVVRS